MMKVFNLRQSERRDKKYTADVVIDGVHHKNVHFGQRSYEHYRDSTPLKLYTQYDHNDPIRRKAFLNRFRSKSGPAIQLSKKYLW